MTVGEWVASAIGAAGVIVALSAVPAIKHRKLLIITCVILLIAALIIGTISTIIKFGDDDPNLTVPPASTVGAPANTTPPLPRDPNPSRPVPPPVQADLEPCATGNQVRLDFQEKTSGLTIHFAAEIKCPAPVSRTYVLIVELNFEGKTYYYSKQKIIRNSGTYRSSINISNSHPNSTRQIFVISVDDAQLDQLRNTGPDGELANRLPDSHRLASEKYTHTRTS